MDNKKILVVTPRFPHPEAGACEQDRADGIRQLKRLGFDVYVIGKVFDWQNVGEIVDFWKREGVEVFTTPYLFNKMRKRDKVLHFLKHPFCLDGAAREYYDKDIISLIEKKIKELKPDYAWFEYTFLWPLYKNFKKRKIPILVRSANFEADHFLEEDGRSLLNYIKYIPKYITEFITVKKSDLLFSITPVEYDKYKAMGAKNIFNLPLRSLYKKIGTHSPKETDKLHVFFSGSTYSVKHNREALGFIIKDLAPKCYKKYGDKFIFYITGAKFPEDLKDYIIDNVIYEGFVENMEEFLKGMDIAVSPSIHGAGMQQKIFEPLTRGFPTITHKRGLAGYDFKPDKDVLIGETVDDFLLALHNLSSFDKRKEISENCKLKAEEQFSKNILDGTIKKGIESI